MCRRVASNKPLHLIHRDGRVWVVEGTLSLLIEIGEPELQDKDNTILDNGNAIYNSKCYLQLSQNCVFSYSDLLRQRI